MKMPSTVLFNESKYCMILKFLKAMRKQSNFLLTILNVLKTHNTLKLSKKC